MAQTLRSAEQLRSMDTGVDTEDVAPDATDARLNFTSPQFDPGLALQTTDLEPPVRDAPVLDNISKCAALLPSASAQPEAKRNPEEAAEVRFWSFTMAHTAKLAESLLQ